MTQPHGAPRREPDSEQQALLAALRAEYAAVFGYGLVAAYSRPDRQKLIETDVAAHRAQRDAVVESLAAAGVAVPAADPGYTVPFPVDDPIPAAKLAVRLENDCAAAWRGALEHAAAEPARRACVDALSAAAVRQAQWRAVLGAPPTVPFPGREA